MPRYAQIDHENICFAVSDVYKYIDHENMILLSAEEVPPLGEKYVDGIWEEVPEEPVEPQITENEILMQTLADIELNNIEAQQERQMLAQQVVDLELMILERGNV